MSDKYESVSREALLIMIRGRDTRIAELEADNEKLNKAIAESCEDMRDEIMQCPSALKANALLDEIAARIKDGRIFEQRDTPVGSVYYEIGDALKAILAQREKGDD